MALAPRVEGGRRGRSRRRIVPLPRARRTKRVRRAIERPERDRRGESAWERALPLYLALVGALLTAVAVLALLRLVHLFLLVFVSALLAAAMSDVVDALERLRVPRLVAASLIQALAVGALAVGAWLVLPPVIDEAAGLADRVPAQVQQVEGLRRAYDELRADHPELASLEEEAASIGSRIGAALGARLLDLPLRVGRAALDVLAISVNSALLVAKRRAIEAFALSLVRPGRRPTVQRVLDQVWTRLGRYVRAKLIVMAIVGAITWGALLLLDVPYALLLAVIVAFGELVPQVGPWLARVPLLLVAALSGPATLGLVALASLVIENLKGYLISPAVEGDQLDIDPLVVVLAVLAGGALLGPIGALVAVPAAAAVQVIVEEVLLPARRRQLAEEGPVLPAQAGSAARSSDAASA